MKTIRMVILVFSLISCKSNQTSDNLSPIQIMENYNGNSSFNIRDKLLSAPDIIINSLNEMDNANNYFSYKLNDYKIHLFLEYYEYLPLKYKKIITEKVIGIYFIDNYSGGGMTLPVFVNNGDMYMVLFFNQEILKKNITEWINSRDNSSFLDDKHDITLNVECNGDYYALIHTLFHEASHVYDYYNFETPFTEPFQKNKKTILPTAFTKDIWSEYDKPKQIYDFSRREDISFYGFGEKIDKTYAIEIFQALNNTPFSSLYASKTWAEDFAEGFTWYYLKKYFEIEYITKVYKNENLVIVFNPNENELARKRYKIFEKIME